jgi:ABC-2 type transport system ATP-binding protein
MREGEVFVDFQQVGKRYRSGGGLTSATVRITPGDSFGLVGLNGAGKSTLLRILLGFARPSSGRAILQGLPPAHPSARKGIGYLSETLVLPRNLTPVEFVRTIQSIATPSNGTRGPREWLQWAGLPEHRWRVPCSSLSKGQAQRVGLAQAFATADAALVLDEPSTGLDAVGRADFLQMVRDWKTPHKTLLLTSHILSDVEALCDRVCVLHDGRIHFTGDTADFLRQFAASSLQDAFVRFIQQCRKS